SLTRTLKQSSRSARGGVSQISTKIRQWSQESHGRCQASPAENRRHAIRLQLEIYHRAHQERQIRQQQVQPRRQHLPPQPVVGN
ncbi:unnamed protein product, partial [Ectocarpus fasciculatus]